LISGEENEEPQIAQEVPTEQMDQIIEPEMA